MGADYPLATWIPADPSNFRVATRARVSLIVIHCTDGHADPRGTAEMFSTPKAQRKPPVASSAHFVVGQDGSVIQCVAIKDVAYHAHAANDYSIGIEHSARTPGEWGVSDPGLPPSAELYDASAELVAWLCTRLGIQPTRVAIVGHNEADRSTTHQKCPTGCGWNWRGYMDLVVSEYAKVSVSV
jgi:N-acetyl-anhydromuramyl-L-alanine amidase AmpD